MARLAARLIVLVVLFAGIPDRASGGPPPTTGVLGRPGFAPSGRSPTRGIVGRPRPVSSAHGGQSHHGGGHVSSGHHHAGHPHGSHHHGNHHHHDGLLVVYPGGWPFFGGYGQFGWSPGYAGYFSYGPTYSYAPLVLPTERLFGPQAVRRMLGPLPQARPAARVHQPDLVLRRAAAGAGGGRAVPAANEEARRRAWRFVDFGDAHFREARFRDALQRYRKARTAARDLAEARFREGHALALLGRLADAAASYRRGLELSADWPTSNFRFETLYGGDGAIRREHRRVLTEAVRERPHDGDALFLLGVALHFDGREDLAGTYFRQARDLGGMIWHIEAFLAAEEDPN